MVVDAAPGLPAFGLVARTKAVFAFAQPLRVGTLELFDVVKPIRTSRADRVSRGSMMMLVLTFFFLLLSGAAHAGAGPWVIGTGQGNLYLGAETQRLTRLQIQDAGGADAEVIDVGEGLSSFGLKAVGTVGVTSRFDLEAEVPWYRVIANRDDHPLCELLGLGACNTTESLGILSLRGKGLLLDELFGAPFSLAVYGELRVGTFTAKQRQRITNIGEGTTDTGLGVTLGRSGGLGAGYWSGYVDAGWRYRWPNTTTYPQFNGDTIAPGYEWTGLAQVVFSPTPVFGFGPSFSTLYRPQGLDFKELDLTDVDRFAALRIANARAGAVAVVRNPRSNASANLSVLRTVAAMNNPTNVWVVGVGVSISGPLVRQSTD